MQYNRYLDKKKKRQMKAVKKREKIKPEQENLCRFVEVRYEVFERKPNGNYRHSGNAFAKGLQIRNKVYFQGGKYKYVNRNSLKIIRTYQDVPEWASVELVELYEQTKQRIEMQSMKYVTKG